MLYAHTKHKVLQRYFDYVDILFTINKVIFKSLNLE